MVTNAGLTKSFYAQAIKNSFCVINLLTSIAIGLKTPMEMWNGKTTNYSSLHVFGCPVYVMYNS